MFNPLQIVLLVVLVGFMVYQKYNIQIISYAVPVFCGLLVGLIMGDVTTGLLVGGTMCLMSLGLFGAGGSSVPEYNVGCIAGAAFAIAMGQSGNTAVTTALTIGIPVAALGTELDVLGKMTGSFFIHRMEAAAKRKNWKAMGAWMWTSQIPFLGLWMLPMLLLVTVGSNYVQMIINAIPVWLENGLTVASGMLPALGFAILLRQMPMRKYGYFLLIGYVLAAYAGMDMLAIALLGVVICVFIFQLKQQNDQRAAESEAVMTGGEYEDE